MIEYRHYIRKAVSFTVTDAYGALAPIYDTLMTDIPYDEMAACPELARQRFGGRKIKTILDLGCGTGRLTEEFCRRGYDVVGADLSEDMLADAHARFAAYSKPPLLLHQDMRQIDLYDTVDAAVSTLDCINYLPNLQDIRQCFGRIHLFLNSDGLFIFDVNTPYKFRTAFADNCYVYESEDGFCTWQNEYHPKSRFCKFYLTIFRPDRNGRYRRYDEMQKEYCYSDKSLCTALEQTGFSLCGIFSDYALSPTSIEDQRHIFVAKKV